MRRALTSFISTVGVAGLLSAGALTVAAPSASAEACPNQGFRVSYSAALPDCRAYELVSPPNVQPYFTTFGQIQNVTFGAAIIGEELGTFASASSIDSGIAFFSTFAPPGSTTDGPYYLSSRGAGGWSTQNVVPPQSTEVSEACLPYTIDWSANLERGILADGFKSLANTCGADEPELVPGEPRGAQNLFLRDSATGTFQLIDQSPLNGKPETALFQTGSSDLGIVLFSETAKLTPEAPTGTDYYVWAGGSVDRLLTILPNGQAVEGKIPDAAVPGPITTSPTFNHALAPDGSRAEFTAGGDLYSRQNPGAPQSALNGSEECEEPSNACTVQIDSSETAQPGGGGEFAGASGTGGEVVYFTDTNQLTADSTATAGEPDLYEYDFRKSAGERLTDLTVDQNAGEHADVLGYVGTNETGAPGEFVYFVANGVLASNQNTTGSLATTGEPNLYMAHAGAISYIATLNAETDSCDWENICISARVSPNGKYVGFNSLEQLTGFNNLDAVSGQTDQEIFLYEGDAEDLTCASCGPNGAQPTAPASIKLPEGEFVFTPIPLYPQHAVSNNGQVFFDTQTPLAPAARNGLSNVYEYEHGQLNLLSSGTAESPSYFYDASVDGGDVYLITAQALAPGGSSAELSIYDARVGGGTPALPVAPEPCSGEACSGVQSIAPRSPAISSASIAGSGNLEPAVSKPAIRSLSSAQKLAKALKSCRAKRNKHKRGVCEAQARKRYRPQLKKLKKSAKTINRRGK
jgi:hypothetical protein